VAGAPGRSASPIPKSAAPTAESAGMVPTSVVCSSSMRPATERASVKHADPETPRGRGTAPGNEDGECRE
jgi:hypothetical protein